MDDAIVDRELGANRIKLAERRLRRLFSDVFDEVHALKAYLNVHPTDDESVHEFVCAIEEMAEEFTIDSVIDGDAFYQD